MPTRPLLTSYQDDLKLFPDMWHKIGVVVATVFLLTYPFWANARWLTMGNETLYTIVGAVGLMILTGFTGQISLGHAAFLTIGSYTAAILGAQYGVPFWMIIILAGVISAIFGLLIGPFALRLEGLYLAIVTIGFLEIVRYLLQAFPKLSGGASGHLVPMHTWFVKPNPESYGTFGMEKYTIMGFTFSPEQKMYFLFLVITLLVVYFAKNLMRSNTGRAMMAVRDHDLAASVMGVNPARTKIISFGISAFVAGVAGAMIGFKLQFLNISSSFEMLAVSVKYIAIVVLGGVGTIFGAIAGTLVFTILEPVTESIAREITLVKSIAPNIRSTIIFSLIVCGFMIFEPLGLFGIWLRIKRYFMAWPFRY